MRSAPAVLPARFVGSPPLRSSRTVREKHERHQAEQGDIRPDVAAGEVVLLRERALPVARSGPVLAQDRPLVAGLAVMSAGKAHAVAGDEEQRRVLAAAQQATQARLGCLLTQHGLHVPARLAERQLLGQGLAELPHAEPRRHIVVVLRREHRDPPGAGRPGCFCGHDAAGVAGILVRALEVETADRVLNVELVLEGIWDGLGVADDEQVVRHLIRVGRSGADTVAGQELAFGLPRQYPCSPPNSR
jgi:hypothetical protein